MPRVIDNIRKLAVMITIASPLIAVMGWGVDGVARAAEGQLRFTLVAVSEAPITNGVKHLLLLSGHGTFTPGSVNGGGSYLYVDNATKVPKTILSNGTWKATEVLSWTPAEEGATYGSTHPGFLDLRVDLIPKQGPVIHGATLRINCRVGLAGIKPKDPDTGETLAEGFWLTIPATTSFGPTTAVGTFVPRNPILGITDIGEVW